MGGRPDASVMDAPASIHARKLIPWVIVQGILVATGANAIRRMQSRRMQPLLPLKQQI